MGEFDWEELREHEICCAHNPNTHDRRLTELTAECPDGCKQEVAKDILKLSKLIATQGLGEGVKSTGFILAGMQRGLVRSSGTPPRKSLLTTILLKDCLEGPDSGNILKSVKPCFITDG